MCPSSRDSKKAICSALTWFRKFGCTSALFSMCWNIVFFLASVVCSHSCSLSRPIHEAKRCEKPRNPGDNVGRLQGTRYGLHCNTALKKHASQIVTDGRAGQCSSWVRLCALKLALTRLLVPQDYHHQHHPPHPSQHPPPPPSQHHPRHHRPQHYHPHHNHQSHRHHHHHHHHRHHTLSPHSLHPTPHPTLFGVI